MLALKPPSLLIGMIRDPLQWDRWADARALLHPALMLSDEDWPAVETDLTSNANQLWAVMEGGDLLAAAVTRVATSREGPVAEIYLIGGHDFRHWVADLNETIEASAREIGCIAMRSYGRPGWQNPLGALGWKVKALAYEKMLSPEDGRA